MQGQMSHRAGMAARKLHEMPLENWTRKEIIRELEYMCRRIGIRFNEQAISKMSDEAVVDDLFEETSEHHVGDSWEKKKFYSVDPDAVYKRFKSSCQTPLEERSAMQKLRAYKGERENRRVEVAYGYENEDAELSYIRAVLQERFAAKHGFPSQSVAAYIMTHPDKVHAARDEYGKLSYKLTSPAGAHFACSKSKVFTKLVRGFDAVDPELIEIKHQRSEIRDLYGYELPWHDISRKRDVLRAEFLEEHGYQSYSVAAYAAKYPENCKLWKENGIDMLEVRYRSGRIQVIEYEDAKEEKIGSFDAVHDDMQTWISSVLERRAKLAEAFENDVLSGYDSRAMINFK